MAAQKELAFVDREIPNLDRFLRDLRPDVKPILIERNAPALPRIAAIMASHEKPSIVHIVAHGGPGFIDIGSDPVTLESLEDQQGDLAAIGQALAIDGALLVWSCRASAGARGAEFAARLEQSVGARVAIASSHVGAVQGRGQWDLDTGTAAPFAVPPLSSEGVQRYPGVLDKVSWSATKTGVEGSSIALGAITGSWTKLSITGIPVGAVLSDGLGHSFTAAVGSTKVDVTNWSLGTLSITPYSDADFKLTAVTGGGKSASETVNVNPLAPTIVWDAGASGIEGGAIALGDLSVTVNKFAADGAGNTLKSLVISTLPVGSMLSDGHGHSFTATVKKTTLDITNWSLADLTIKTKSDANFTLKVTATVKDANGDVSSATATEIVTVNPLAPTVAWGAAPVPGAEGSAIALGTISATANNLTGDAGHNSLKSLVISAIPEGAVLSDGHGHSFTAASGNQAIDVMGWNLASLSVTPAAAANFNLVLTATATDAEGNTNTATASESVIVTPLVPVVTAGPVSGEVGSAIALNIAATAGNLAGDTSAISKLVIGGVPDGATLADAKGHSFTAAVGSNAVDIVGWDFPSLSLTASATGAITLSLTVTERDVDGDASTATATELVTVNAPADHAPTIVAGTPSTDLVEAGLASSGADTSVVQLSKGDVDGVASYDIKDWVDQGSGVFAKAGAYGTAFLDTVADTLTYKLDNSAGQTNALAASQQVSDAFSIAVTESDGALTASTQVSFVIAGTNDAPTITAATIPQVLADSAATDLFMPLSGSLSASDPEGDALSFALAAGQSGTGTYGSLAVDALGQWTYTPANDAINGLAAGANVSDAFDVAVADGHGGATTHTLIFNVTGENDAPVFTSVPVVTVAAGTLTATDAEGDTVAFGLGTGETGIGAHGSLSVDAAGNWSYAANPAAGLGLVAGTKLADTFALEANDGNGGIGTQLLTVETAVANVAPAFTSLPVAADIVDTASSDNFLPLSGALAASDDNGDAVTFSLAPGQTGVGAYGTLALDSAGNWSYQADGALVDALPAGAQASDTFTAVVDDGHGGTATQALMFTIAGANDAPMITAPAEQLVPANTTVVADLTAVDPDAGAQVNFAISGGADSAAFDVINNQLVFKAPATPGIYGVDVTASDGIDSTTQSMMVTVSGDSGGGSVTTPFTVIDPSQATLSASAITSAVFGAAPGITIDPNSLAVTAGPSSIMLYDGSMTSLGIGSGLLITSGTMPSTSNTVGYFGQDNMMSGDPALDAVVNTVFQTVSYDATTVSFSFDVTDPSVTGITLDAVFGSDEFPEWVDQFVDIAVVLVNGTNVAYFNNDPMAPLSVVSSNLAANYFMDNTANLSTPSFGGVAIPGVSSTFPIEYDGISHLLKIFAPVHFGTNTIKIGIADTGDHIYDSGLFISHLAASSAPTSGVVLDVPCTNGDDILTGTAASESFDAKSGDDLINAAGGDDIVLGGIGNDSLDGGSGNDFIDGGSGFNVVSGGDGDDVIQHSSGQDVIDGGSGVNTLKLDLSNANTAQDIDISDSGLTHLLADGSSFVNIETVSVHSGGGNDVLVGGSFADLLDGGSGDDVLTGNGGNDQLIGGAGADMAVYSGLATDYIVATVGVDLYQITDLRAASPDGVDTLSGIEALKFFDGIVNLSNVVATGVTINGTNGDNFINAGQTVPGQPLPTDNGDTIHGNGGDDHINAGAGADKIFGDAGNDLINGGGGDDIITGGAGADEMKGGAGADHFVFTAVSDSPVGAAERDQILDFSQAEGDKIDLTQIGDFALVASFTQVAGQLVATHSGDGYLVQGDVNGDGLADLAFQVNMIAPLVSTDFIH